MPVENTQRRTKRFITGHNEEGKAIIEQIDEGWLRNIDNGVAQYNELWQTSTFPVDINHDDCRAKEKTVMSLSLPNGVILRMVDRSPGSYSAMHRTQSLDYGIMIAGEMECIMDSGEKIVLKPGDVCIQRQTNHQWHNATKSWNRMVFAMMDAKPLEVAGQVYKGETGYEHVKDIASRL